jgi:aminoglycoside phosphotransferase (APT) family kinase protein
VTNVIKLHADEVDIDGGLVRRLLSAQFPQWADLPLTLLSSQAGTSNVLYRLGDDLVVRLPRNEGAADGLARDQLWLSRLAPYLPLAVPEVVGVGVPGEGFPLAWSVCRWLGGDDILTTPTFDEPHAAVELGRFVAALRGVGFDGPPGFRGGALHTRDELVRAAIDALDVPGAAEMWDEALALPQWTGEPVWVHSDLLPGNLLARDGRLIAVIDFGGVGVGDPACDVMAAWTVLSAETRPLFRAQIDVDDATWARGRGWALSFGLSAAHYYGVRSPLFGDLGKRVTAEVLADR